MDSTALAQRAGELAGDARALSGNLDRLADQVGQLAQQAATTHGGSLFVFELTIFVLACFVGYYVVWRVTPALHSPLTSRAGNLYGIVGMVIAIATTLAMPHVVSYPIILLGILLGGAIGTYIAIKIQMTALPQLVAAFHSLVGLAAVCVAAA